MNRMYRSVHTGCHQFDVIQMAILIPVMLLVLCGAVYPLAAAASDRDTPAYLIYVDPVTGKYTTKQPDANAQAVNGPTAGSLESDATAGSPSVMPVHAMKAPLTAVLLLVGLALSSLFFRKQDS
jgi:hypothetical protein